MSKTGWGRQRWFGRAEACALSILRSHGTFSVSTLKALGVPAPADPAMWAQMTARLVARGLIRPCGRVSSAKGGMSTVWMEA